MEVPCHLKVKENTQSRIRRKRFLAILRRKKSLIDISKEISCDFYNKIT